MGSTQRQRRTGSSQGSPGASWAVGLLVIACGLLMVGAPASVPVSVRAASMLEPGPQSAHGTLVGYESLDVCAMPTPRQRAALRAAGYAAPASALETATVTLANPIRKIKDPYPSFAAVSVDVERNEVVFTDESLFQVLVYDRLENTPAGSEASKPKRVIAGRNTNIEFQSGVYVDAKSGEIFAVNNDTRDTTVVFGPGANGDVTPVRSIETAHGTFGIAVAEAHDEVLLTVQHDSAVVAYTKRATGDDKPIRLLQGDRTKLADPHGIAYDPRDDVIFVANFGARSERDASRDGSRGRTSGGRLNWPLGRSQAVLGSGSIGPPSVSIYRRAASGNEAPLRVIQGAATQFDWPTGLAFDPSRRELYVANDMGPSILVFDADAQGNASPRRVLKGTRTRLVNPTSVALDLKNRELWVANFGGHAGLVFDIGASGNASPKRVIRNAPPDAPSLMIGNPGALAYDPKREHLLVPN